MEAGRRKRRINRERISKAGIKRYKNKETKILKLNAVRDEQQERKEI